jgi:hypothetical protein
MKKEKPQNAFTGATNSISWRSVPQHNGSQKGGAVTAKKQGSPLLLAGSSVRAYSAAGVPK